MLSLERTFHVEMTLTSSTYDWLNRLVLLGRVGRPPWQSTSLSPVWVHKFHIWLSVFVDALSECLYRSTGRPSEEELISLDLLCTDPHLLPWCTDLNKTCFISCVLKHLKRDNCPLLTFKTRPFIELYRGSLVSMHLLQYCSLQIYWFRFPCCGSNEKWCLVFLFYFYKLF